MFNHIQIAHGAYTTTLIVSHFKPLHNSHKQRSDFGDWQKKMVMIVKVISISVDIPNSWTVLMVPLAFRCIYQFVSNSFTLSWQMSHREVREARL